MAIDSSIALSYQPPQIQVQVPQPLQQFGQILTLGNLMQQRQLLPIELETKQLQLDQLRRVMQEQQDYAPWLKSQLYPSTAQGTTAAPLPALTGQPPAVSAGPALTGQAPSYAPLATAPSGLPDTPAGQVPAIPWGTMNDVTQPPVAPVGAPAPSLAAMMTTPTPAPAPAVPAPVVALPPAAGSGMNIGKVIEGMLARFPTIGPERAQSFLKTLTDQQDLEIKQHDNNAKAAGELAGIGIAIRDSKNPAAQFPQSIWEARNKGLITDAVAQQMLSDGYDKHANDVQAFIDKAQTAQTQSEIAKNNLEADLKDQQKAGKDIRTVVDQPTYDNFLAARRPNVRSQFPATFSPQVKDVIQGLETPAAQLPKTFQDQLGADAQVLAAAKARDLKTGGHEFDDKVAALPEDRRPVFAGAGSPLEVMQRAQNPDQYVTAQHANLQTALEAGRLRNEREKLGLDKQKFDAEYGPGTAESAVEQIFNNPDSVREVLSKLPPGMFTQVQKVMQAKHGMPLPVPLEGADKQKETSALATQGDAQWIRQAMQNPNIANNVGAILGRLQNVEQATGEATGLTGADAQLAQQFRTRMQTLLANEAGAFRSRGVPSDVINGLMQSSPNIKMDAKMLMGALDGVDSEVRNRLDAAEQSRWGSGKMRPPEARGLRSSTPSPDQQRVLAALPRDGSIHQLSDGSVWQVNKDGSITPAQAGQ